MDFIQDIVNLGDDAMTNQFIATFNLGNVSLSHVRLTGFTPPMFTQTVSKHNWKNISYNKPSSKVEFERKLTLTFRVDSNYQVYKALKDYRLENCSATYALSSLSDTIRDSSIIIQPLKSSVTHSEKNRWTYEAPWISDIQLKEYNYGESKPQEVTVIFYFGNYTDTVGGKSFGKTSNTELPDGTIDAVREIVARENS